MTKSQYEILREALAEDLLKVSRDYEAGLLNVEHAHMQERHILNEMLQVEADWHDQQNC